MLVTLSPRSKDPVFLSHRRSAQTHTVVSPRSPRLLSVAPRMALVHESAHRFSAYLSELERRLKRSPDTVPSLETRRECAAKFWSMMSSLQRSAFGDAVLIDGAVAPYRPPRESDPILEQTKREVRQILGAWLWRSDLFHRSHHKPHGYAGDFKTLEHFYAIEKNDAADATKPALVNCLDYVFATLHCVHGLWELRRRLRTMLDREHVRAREEFAILDVGCGGAPYLRDFLTSLEDASRIHVALVDQDASALEFCRQHALWSWATQLESHVGTAWRTVRELDAGRFDVVIASALVDDIDDDEMAAELIESIYERLRPGGVAIVSCFHPLDPSEAVRDWILDWRWNLRTEEELAALFPKTGAVTAERASNGVLSLVTVRRPLS
jgi:2-polyprenyl-3-methyl-5-hydroxy-6-metoxy-1,4-benzoquinol methylase